MVMATRVSSRQVRPSIIFLFVFLSLLFLSFSYLPPPIPAAKQSTSSPANPDSRRPATEQAVRPAKSAVNSALLNLPLSFEAVEKSNEFLVRGAGYCMLVTPSATTIALTHRRREKLLSTILAGANKQATVAKLDELPGKRNYLIGNDPSKWRIDVPTYSRVRFEKVYPGVNVTYYGNQHQLEYDFEVAAGADPRQIQFAFGRNVNPRIAANGDLVLRTADGEVIEQEPVAYQEVDGDRRFVET